jgi:threonine/homoserine/homoserine lactone efflux protein
MLGDYLIRYSAVVVFGIILGFLSAIPAGAVQVQVVKSSMRGRWRTAIAVAMGSGSSDMLYGILTLFGLGAFMMSDRFQICFYLAGVAVLCYLLYRSILDYRRPAPERGGKKGRSGQRRGFFAGFMLAATNPSIVLWWIVGFKVFLDFGLFPEVTVPLRIAFVFAGVCGLAGYLVLLALVIARFHRNISEKTLHRMNLSLIVIYSFLIVYFIYKLVQHAHR